MGAMENWGLVTYRTTAVLFDEGKSDTRYKNRIAYVVAHGEFLVWGTMTASGCFLRMNRRIGPPMVWQSCDYGLVERALAERRLCNLGWMVGR